MAITGTFAADFSSFSAAVSGAVVKLHTFEENSNKVGVSLTRATDALSGVKIVQQATIAAEAVERIGGASKLTETELQRVSATAREAAAKLTAMGQDVPPKIRELAGAFHEVDAGVTGAKQSVGQLVAGFVTAEAIIGAAKMAVRGVKDAIQELADIAMEGAAFSDVSSNFEHLTTQAGLLGSTLMGTLREGTQNTVNDFELMKSVNQDLAAGMVLTDQQFGTLAKGAFALAQATGGDVKTAFDTMNDAMLTGRTRALAMLTGKIDLEAAETKYAASIHQTSETLTESEKLEAARLAMLDRVGAVTERVGEQTAGLDERVAQAQTAFANFRYELGEVIADSSVLEAGMVTLGRELVAAFGGNRAALIKNIADMVTNAAIAMGDLGIIAVETGKGLLRVFSTVAAPIAGAATAVLFLTASMASGHEVLMKVAAAMPGATDATRGFAAQAKSDAANMWAWVKSADEMTRASFQAVIGNSEAEKSLNTFGGVILKTRDAMITARDTHIAVGPVVAALGPAHDTAGAAAARHAEEVRKLTESKKKEKEALAAAAAELARATTANIAAASVDREIYLLKLKQAGDGLALKKAQLAIELNDAIAALDKRDAAYEHNLAKVRELNALQVADVVKADQLVVESGSQKAAALIASSQRTLDAARAHIGDFTVSEMAAFEQAVTDAQASAAGMETAMGDAFEEMVRKSRAAGAEIGAGLVPSGGTLGPQPGTAAPGGAAAAPPMSWSQAMAAQAKGEGTLSFSMSGGQAGGTATRRDVMLAAEKNRYFGPVDEFGRPDYEALGLAAGGPVAVGGRYLVGERGPELFTPGVNGSITPNHALGGTTVINNTFIVNGTGADVARIAKDELMRSIKHLRKLPA